MIAHPMFDSARNRRASSRYMHNPEMITHMSDYGLRARRRNGAPTVLLQGSVTLDSRAAIGTAADASGVKISYYLDAFVGQTIEAEGHLPILEAPRRDDSGQLDAVAELLLEPAPAIKPAELVPLQGRVLPATRDAVHAAASASGVGKTAYLNLWVEKILETEGALPLVDRPRRDRINQIEEIRKFSEVASRSAA